MNTLIVGLDVVIIILKVVSTTLKFVRALNQHYIDELGGYTIPVKTGFI